MLVQSACQVLSRPVSSQPALPLSRALAGESLRRPQCPRCGSVLLIAEESRFDVKGRIDHDWSCDGCGNKFVTSIRVWPR